MCSAAPSRIALHEKLLTTHGFGLFSDHSGIDGETLETFKKSAVGLVLPSNEARTAPTAGSQLVKTAVVPHSECHVCVDARLARAPERSPRMQAGWMLRDDCGDGVAPRLGS